MNSRLNIPKFWLICLFISLISSIALSVQSVSAAEAYEYYTSSNGYQKCVSDSNRPNIYSVTNYACEKATAKAQNACASWIGPANDSSSNVIDATGASGDIPIKIWGMCTYYENTSSMMQIMNHSDGDSITCSGGNCNFTRTGNWGASSIGSKDATLNVAKFIAHAPTVVIGGQTYYYRVVMLKRQHGGNTSRDVDFSYIYLKADSSITPTPVVGTCDSVNWPNPTSYTNSDENEGTTSVDIRIRNTASRFGGVGYGTWNDGTIFAMPTDQIAWHTCYYPGVQTTTNTEVSSVNNVNWDNYESPLPDDVCLASDSSRRNVSYEKLQNAVKKPTISHDWQNLYSLSGDATTGNLIGGSAGLGETGVLESDNGRPTTVDDVGKELIEYADTGEPVHAKISSAGYGNTTVEYSCPCCTHGPDQDGKYHDDDGDECSPSSDSNDCAGGCCTNTYSSELKNATVEWDNPPDHASVKIPYNYQKRTGVNIYDDVVYAGESTKIKEAWTMIIPRWNNNTLAAYATKTKDESEIRLYAYITPNSNGDKSSFETTDANGCHAIRTTNKQCIELDDDSKVLNQNGKLEGDEDRFFKGNNYNVFDASAGDYMCFVSSVTKEASNGYEDMTDAGNGRLAYSEPACAIIAKRPSFQVWGSDMYSNSEINAKTAAKRNVYNAYKDNISHDFDKTGSGSTIYGSWVEEGLILGNDGLGHSGVTTDLASGAATGLNTYSKMAYSGSTGDFCNDQSPLTLANYDGSGCRVSGSGITLNLNNDDRRKLISYWIENPGDSSPSSPTGATINYTNYSTDTTISAMTIPKSTTEIIEVDGKLTIGDDITYDGHYNNDFTTNNTAKDIPKMIIYANNVDIKCSVEKLDAIIITKEGGTVNTCSDASNNDSDPKRGKQLKIFGMVITDNIVLGRTYGSAAWKGLNAGELYDPAKNGQKEPAEVFDFDSSILLWSEFMASSAETDTLQVVYQVEIAPRY